MANETVSQTQSSAAVSLFQKAHGRMTTLQRIDEQVNSLLDQRRKIQDELRAVQGLINEEFDRVVKGANETPNRMLAHMAESAKSLGSTNGNGHREEAEDLADTVA